MRYCVGGSGSNGTARERTNKEVVEAICSALDDLLPAGAPHSRLVTPVTDRPGHDRRYAIDPTRISSELGWRRPGRTYPGTGPYRWITKAGQE